MRFLLDENIHHGLLSFLRELGHDATRSPKGLTNGAVIGLAISEQRTLITHDADFARQPLTMTHPGVILVKVAPQRLEALRGTVKRLLVSRPSHEPFINTLVVLFEDRWDEFPWKFENIPSS